MVWLSEHVLIGGMVDLAKERDPGFNDWWRDESVLDAWWTSCGFSRTVKGVCVPVPCGGVLTSWFTISTYDENGKAWFDLIVISPDNGYEPVPSRAHVKEVLCAGSRYWPDDCIKWQDGKNSAKIPNVGSSEGGRVACMTDEGVRIGYAVGVAPNGWVERVNVGGLGEVDAKVLAPKWWPIRGRDGAFDMFFNNGEFLHKSYLSLIYKLMHAQNRIDKAAGLPKLSRKQREKLAEKIGTDNSESMDRAKFEEGMSYGRMRYQEGHPKIATWMPGNLHKDYYAGLLAGYDEAVQAELIG